MSQEVYLKIPKDVRQLFKSERVIIEETQEMKEDPLLKELKRNYYKARDALHNRKFDLKHNPSK